MAYMNENKRLLRTHSKNSGEKKREKRERAQEDFENVCLPVEMRGQDRGTWTDQVGHRRPAAPSYSYHHLLSAHDSLDAALSSLLSLTPHNKPSRGGGFIFILQ